MKYKIFTKNELKLFSDRCLNIDQNAPVTLNLTDGEIIEMLKSLFKNYFDSPQAVSGPVCCKLAVRLIK